MTLTYERMSQILNREMTNRGEWCGVPLPLPGLRIQIEPKNPWRDGLLSVQDVQAQPDPDDEGATVINSWFSKRDGCQITIIRDKDGRVFGGRTSHRNGRRAEQLLNTMRASEIWSVDAELKAIDTLQTLIKPHLLDAYVLTGTFLETSKRSGLTYLFRRLAPTLVMTPRGRRGEPSDEMRLLCALCLHPIAYYEQSHAGAMVPTDDVIAHLLLMRGDESLYWRRADQHDPSAPEANLMF